MSRRRRCWKKFGFCSLFLTTLSSTTTAYGTALDPPRKKQDQESQSSSVSISSKTRAAVVAESDLHSTDSSWNQSKRMTNQGNLAQHILSESEASSSDFANRLLEEMKTTTTTKQHNIVVTATNNDSQQYGSSLLLYGLITVAFTSAILTPTVFVDSLVNVLLSSVALLVPWLWMERLSLFSKETVLMSLSYVVQVATTRYYTYDDNQPRQERQQQQYYHDDDLVQRVVPTLLNTFRRTLVMEAWSRIWRMVGINNIVNWLNNLYAAAIVQRTTRQEQHNRNEPDTDTNERQGRRDEGGSSSSSLSKLVDTTHEFVDTAIKRGAQKAVTKTIQRNAQAAIGTTLSSLTELLAKTFSPSIGLVPFTKGFIAGVMGY